MQLARSLVAARPLRRIIQNLIEDPLAEGILNGRFLPGATVKVDVEEDLLKLEPVPTEADALIAAAPSN